MANLSTLVTHTCFRTADGEFHGFEGCNDQRGCCFGNCTHVWNYETATALPVPQRWRGRCARPRSDFRRTSRAACDFRQMLPDGKRPIRVSPPPTARWARS